MATQVPAGRGPAADLAVFIGRFQPLHLGHLHIMREALKSARQLLVLVGSPRGPRTFRNPFTYAERERMIRTALKAEELDRVKVLPVPDTLYNDEAWIGGVQIAVMGHAAQIGAKTIALVGYSKDNTSYYLKRFPQWGAIRVDGIRVGGEVISGTKIRDRIFRFEPEAMAWLFREGGNALMDSNTVDFITDFLGSESFERVVAEFDHVREYTALWAKAPFPPTFVTVDAVVVQSGHVLLVKRGGMPGKGLWALPGGFIQADERLEDSVIRELREETRIKVPAPILRGSIKAMRTFDDPHRSSRGRTITHGYLIHLQPSADLPDVRAASDAKETKWMPIGALNPDEMFEDHNAITDTLLRLL
jgi:bifunctional NMN adenylyltransferase/nudix hydrolase